MECALCGVESGSYWAEVENGSRRNPLNKPEMCAIHNFKVQVGVFFFLKRVFVRLLFKATSQHCAGNWMRV